MTAAGETVLITAAAGGVGSAAVQIAAAVGARVVAVASPANHNYLLSLGASDVFDYHAADWAQQVRAVVPGGVDPLFDGAGGQTRDQALDAVRDGGRAISIVLQGTPLQPERGITGESFAAHGGRPRLEQLAALVDAGTLARRPKRYCRSTRPARRWRGSLPGNIEARSRSKSADCAVSGRLCLVIRSWRGVDEQRY